MYEQSMWKNFEKTGMIEDYLKFKSSEKERHKEEQTGESEYEAGHYSNRNDIVGNVRG